MYRKNPFKDLILVKEIWNNLCVLCDKIGEGYAGTEGKKRQPIDIFV